MLIVLKYSIEDDGTVSVATEKHRLNNSGEIEIEVSNPKKFRSKNVDRCISKYAKEFKKNSQGFSLIHMGEELAYISLK